MVALSGEVHARTARRFAVSVVALVATVQISSARVAADDAHSPADRNWPQWRGPRGNGVAPCADPPLSWDATTNIRWRAPVTGAGSATPIVWDDRIFVLSARETDVGVDQPPRPHPDA